ncbi:Hypothetical predicted protein, partial [Paramuricea clavata]
MRVFVLSILITCLALGCIPSNQAATITWSKKSCFPDLFCCHRGQSQSNALENLMPRPKRGTKKTVMLLSHNLANREILTPTKVEVAGDEPVIKYEQSRPYRIGLDKDEELQIDIITQTDDLEEAGIWNFSPCDNQLTYRLPFAENGHTFMSWDWKIAKWFFTADLTGCDMFVAKSETDKNKVLIIHSNLNKYNLPNEQEKNLRIKGEMAAKIVNSGSFPDYRLVMRYMLDQLVLSQSVLSKNMEGIIPQLVAKYFSLQFKLQTWSGDSIICLPSKIGYRDDLYFHDKFSDSKSYQTTEARAVARGVEAGFSLADTKIRNIEEKLNVKISDVLDDLNELKARSEPVSERLVNALLEENTKLKKDNDVLSGRLNNSLLVVSDLNTRIKDIENEKCSLITAIRLIQCADKSHVDSTVTAAEQLKSDDTNVFNQHDLSHNLSMNDVEESIRVVDKNPDYFLSSNKIPESQSLKRKYKSKSKRKGLNLDKNLSENANSTTRSEVLQQIPANNNSTAEPVMQQIPSNDNTMTEPVMQQIPSNVNSITDPVVQKIPSNTSGTNNLHTVPETHNKHANYSVKNVTVVAGDSI